MQESIYKSFLSDLARACPLIAAIAAAGVCPTVAIAQQFDSCTGNNVTATWSTISTDMDSINTAGWWTPLAISGGNRYFAFNVIGTTSGNHKIWIAKLDSSNVLTMSSCLPNSTGTCFYSIDDDGHRQPSIAVDGSGYIHVFSAMHNNGPLYWRSNQPNSVTGGFTYRGGEVPVAANTQGWTYPILATLNGDVYLLVRETATDYHNKAALLYRFSNSGRTWARIYRPAFDSRNTYTVYPDDMMAADGALHIAYSWMDGGTGGLRHRGSYLKYVPNPNSNTGTFYTSSGAAVGVPRKVDNGDVFRPLGSGELLTDITDTAAKPKGYQSAKIAVDPATGYPHVLYRYRDKSGNDNFKVFRSRWNGTSWITDLIYGGGTDSNTLPTMGITHDGSVIRAYYVKSAGGVFLKEKGGICASWSPERALTPGDTTPKRIAVVPGTVDSIYSSRPGVNTLSYGRVPR